MQLVFVPCPTLSQRANRAASTKLPKHFRYSWYEKNHILHSLVLVRVVLFNVLVVGLQQILGKKWFCSDARRFCTFRFFLKDTALGKLFFMLDPECYQRDRKLEPRSRKEADFIALSKVTPRGSHRHLS